MDSGHEATFEAFVTTSWNRLLRVAVLLTGDWGDAEDLVQSALTTCYRRWSRVMSDGSELAYVRKAVVNAYISSVRKRRLREIVTFAVPDRPQDDAMTTVDDRELLGRALRKLSPRVRTAVVLRHYVNLSEAETAGEMACSVGNVKRLTADGLRQLRHYYETTAAPRGVLETQRRADR